MRYNAWFYRPGKKIIGDGHEMIFNTRVYISDETVPKNTFSISLYDSIIIYTLVESLTYIDMNESLIESEFKDITELKQHLTKFFKAHPLGIITFG